MRKIIYNYVTIISVLLVITSCVPAKEIAYFQEIEELTSAETSMNSETKIAVGDLLAINVSALDPETALAFNLFENSGNGAVKSLPYLVNSAGELNFPVLGTVQVVGLTTKELTDKLVELLSEFIINPVVNIRLTNFKVTVLGEVKNPGTFTVSNERISIVEALGLAGDLTIQGKRDNLLLVREIEGKRVVIPIDLSKIQVLNSPYYYLAQNDVLYVEPNKAKRNSSAIGSNTGVLLSTASILISIIAILIK